MALSPGTRLGPYEILEPLGEGGMGQVWKARDTRLNRIVAIKTSLKPFSERFEREAQVIAALNHPHICSIYDVGPDYLVMEYVEGKLLRGPVSLDDARALAGQILDGLEAAHRKGIVHRDLKPGNIMLGKNGVKILDFGLAKIARGPSPDGATETMPLTGEGSLLGTLQYMSPEQVEGQEADARSDIFAFGLVLYELITGNRAFSGKSQVSLAASILKEQPQPIHELQPKTPPELVRVISTCLEKDPEKRWQSAREVKHALEWMAQSSPSATAIPVQAVSPRWKWLLPAIAGFGIGSIGVGAWMFQSQPPQQPAQVSRFEVAVLENVTFTGYVSVSPDGRKLVLNATGERAGLWIRDLDTLEWRQLAGTGGAAGGFWSPDSKYVGFGVQNELKKIDIASGTIQIICRIPSLVGGGDWNRDGTIVFGSRSSLTPLWKVSATGGVAAAMTSVDIVRGENFHAAPAFLPDGRHFIYLRTGAPEVSGIYAGSIDTKLEEQPKERILASQVKASYVNGYLFFMRDGTLMAQPFDTGRMQLTGEPVPVAEHVGTVEPAALFSVSPSGTLAYRSTSTSTTYQLTWFDRQGKEAGTFGPPGRDRQIRISPDGKRAVVSSGSGPVDLWTLDFARGLRSRFTFREAASIVNGVWSPDGSRIVFNVGLPPVAIYEKASSGTGDETELWKEPGKAYVPTGWSSDGRFLLYELYVVANSKSGQQFVNSDIEVLPLEGNRKPVLLLHSAFSEAQATLSPDMRWLAYTSDESGRAEVYVRPFVASGPDGTAALGEGKWQISRDGGNGSKWRADGKEIIFQAPPNGTNKMAVEVKTNGAALEVGIPQRLFQAPIDSGWDVTPDGQRFLLSVASQTQGGNQRPINVVLNWPALLKK